METSTIPENTSIESDEKYVLVSQESLAINKKEMMDGHSDTTESDIGGVALDLSNFSENYHTRPL